MRPRHGGRHGANAPGSRLTEQVNVPQNLSGEPSGVGRRANLRNLSPVPSPKRGGAIIVFDLPEPWVRRSLTRRNRPFPIGRPSPLRRGEGERFNNVDLADDATRLAQNLTGQMSF